jgi:hypothetical protein
MDTAPPDAAALEDARLDAVLESPHVAQAERAIKVVAFCYFFGGLALSTFILVAIRLDRDGDVGFLGPRFAAIYAVLGAGFAMAVLVAGARLRQGHQWAWLLAVLLFATVGFFSCWPVSVGMLFLLLRKEVRLLFQPGPLPRLG